MVVVFLRCERMLRMRRYGIVAADETGTLVKLRDIASGPPKGVVKQDTHFTGIHAMDRQMLEFVQPGFSCIIRTAYKELVPRRGIQAIRHHGVWLDIGDPSAYIDANMTVLDGDVELALDPTKRAAAFVATTEQLDRVAPLWIGDDAVIEEGSFLKRSIIGHGARIASGARLEECVVWDGASVPPGDYRRAIFFGSGVWTDAGETTL